MLLALEYARLLNLFVVTNCIDRELTSLYIKKASLIWLMRLLKYFKSIKIYIFYNLKESDSVTLVLMLLMVTVSTNPAWKSCGLFVCSLLS